MLNNLYYTYEKVTGGYNVILNDKTKATFKKTVVYKGVKTQKEAATLCDTLDLAAKYLNIK